MIALHIMPRLVNFGLQTPEIHAQQNSVKMTRDSLRHFLFPFARCQHDQSPRPNTVRYGNCLSNAMPQSFNPLAF